MSKISLQHIDMVYPNAQGTHALSDINLEIEEGEFVCVLGSSGCGKSTLLEIVAGLLKQTGGKILMDGRALDGPSKDIGVVFQDSSLFPWRTVRKNIEFGLEISKKTQMEKIEMVDKYIHMMGLTGFADRYPHQLSGGMRQRVGLARTLVNSPAVLLMDEPLGALDYMTRQTIQDEIIDLWQREKKTMIFITHDVSEAVYLGTRVVLFSPRPGRVSNIYSIQIDRPRSRTDVRQLELIEEIQNRINEISTDNETEKNGCEASAKPELINVCG